MVQTKYDVPVRRTHKGHRLCLYHFYFIYTEGNLEGNAVYAGNPARKLMSLEDYYEKRKKNGKMIA